MATTYLSDTQATPTNNKKWTWSSWCKFSATGEQYIMSAYTDANNNTSIRFLDDTNRLDFQNYVSSSDAGRLKTTRYLRDPAAWYHIVCIFDSDNATSGDRQQIWINGVRETAFDTETYPSSGAASILNASGIVAEVGRRSDNANMLNGALAHTHFCDGYAYDASYFGETDSTSGIWVAKTSPSVSYGTNGFFLKYASGASGTDSSGNGNNFTVSGTITQTKDTPDNNYATWNPLQNYYDPATIENGNTKFTTAGGTGVYSFRTSTLGMSSGKWYAEIKRAGSADYAVTGIASRFPEASGDHLGLDAGNYSWQDWDGDVFSGNSEVADYTAYDGDVVVMIGLDLDNNKLYLGQNGVWENSADPAAGTGGLSITAPSDTYTGFYHFAAGDYDNGYGQTFAANFGNGYFGTTAVTSAEADGNGEGQFEYEPPTGFFSLCTNNLGSES